MFSHVRLAGFVVGSWLLLSASFALALPVAPPVAVLQVFAGSGSIRNDDAMPGDCIGHAEVRAAGPLPDGSGWVRVFPGRDDPPCRGLEDGFPPGSCSEGSYLYVQCLRREGSRLYVLNFGGPSWGLDYGYFDPNRPRWPLLVEGNELRPEVWGPTYNAVSYAISDVPSYESAGWLDRIDGTPTDCRGRVAFVANFRDDQSSSMHLYGLDDPTCAPVNAEFPPGSCGYDLDSWCGKTNPDGSEEGWYVGYDGIQFDYGLRAADGTQIRFAEGPWSS